MVTSPPFAGAAQAQGPSEGHGDPCYGGLHELSHHRHVQLHQAVHTAQGRGPERGEEEFQLLPSLVTACMVQLLCCGEHRQ